MECGKTLKTRNDIILPRKESEEVAICSDMISNLHKALECPVCLDVVKDPVQCRGGHITCSTCANKVNLQACSMCGQNYVEERPTFLNGLLEALPRFCKYAENGCKQVCVSTDDHENFCSFREISCRQGSCEVKVPLCHMQKHYEEIHPRALLNKVDNEIFWSDFNPVQFQFAETPVLFDGHFFYLTLKNNNAEKNLKFTLEAFISGIPKYEYFVTITLDEDLGFVHKRTIQAVTMKGDNDDRGMELVTETENSEDYCMTVSHKFLHLIFGENKDLTFQLHFARV